MRSSGCAPGGGSTEPPPAVAAAGLPRRSPRRQRGEPFVAIGGVHEKEEGLAGWGGSNLLLHLLDRGDRLAVHLQDHVARLDAGLRRRALGRHAGNQDAFARREITLLTLPVTELAEG